MLRKPGHYRLQCFSNFNPKACADYSEILSKRQNLKQLAKDEARRSAFLTSSLKTAVLLVCRPHFESRRGGQFPILWISVIAYTRCGLTHSSAVAAAAKLLQSCPTLCDPTDSNPPGSPIPGILQARTLEWGAIAISNTFLYSLYFL